MKPGRATLDPAVAEIILTVTPGGIIKKETYLRLCGITPGTGSDSEKRYDLFAAKMGAITQSRRGTKRRDRSEDESGPSRKVSRLEVPLPRDDNEAMEDLEEGGSGQD